MRFVLIFSLLFIILSCDPIAETPEINITSDTADLAALSVSVGTLTPSFDPKILAYTVAVSDSDSLITVTPTAKEIGANITVDSFTVVSGATSPQIALTLPVNTILIRVTAPDSLNFRLYTIVISRVSTEILEITGSWAGTDTFGDVTYVFSDAAWSTSRPGTAIVASGTVSSYDNANNRLIFYIVAHTDPLQIGNYHKIEWTPDSPGTSSGATIDLTVYIAASTSASAANEDGILITSHTLTKD